MTSEVALAFLAAILVPSAIGTWWWGRGRAGWSRWVAFAQSAAAVFWVVRGQPWWALLALSGGVVAVLAESMGERA